MDTMLLNDHILVKRVQEGNMTAFTALVERYKNKIYAIALDMTGNHHDAEDISQDVFLKAYRALPRFKGGASVNTWLYRMTINTCIDRGRNKARKALKPKGMVTDDDLSEPAQGHGKLSHPENEMEKNLLQQHIQRALDCLTHRERAVFVLRHYHSMPLKEIAECLSISEGTIKSTLFRTLKRLREKLAPYIRGEML